MNKSVLAIGILLTSLVSAGGAPDKPNIVFIMADDLGWQDVGFMGSKWFETPALDALAKESLVFRSAYMYPTCSPSRTALLTGKYSFRTGVYNVPVLEKGSAKDNIFSRWTVGLEHTVYAKPLGQAGYKSIHLGKWHIVGPDPKKELASKFPLTRKLRQPKNGDLSWLKDHLTPEIQQYYPIGRGFDENVGGCWWGDPARGHAQGYNAPGGGYVAPYKNPFITEGKDGEWLTDRLTTDAIDFIERHKKGPFFVNLNFYAPHRPTVARSKESLDAFMKKPGDPVTGQGMAKTQGKKKRKGGKGKAEIAAYATMVKAIDENVQRIITYLDKSGLRKNTIVFFTSDNGSNGLQSRTKLLRGVKGNVYEGGIRVPALVNWPGRIKPGTSEIPIAGIDYFPTFLDLAGIVDYKGVLDGKSLVPIFNGDDSLKSRPLFWHLASTYKDKPCSIMRKGKWKLIQFLKDGKTELYNLETDLAETRNMTTQQPEIAQRMTKELSGWRKANNVPLPPSSSLEF